MELKKSKPPKTNIVNPDYKRRVLSDGPSSDEEDANANPAQDAKPKIETEEANKLNQA